MQKIGWTGYCPHDGTELSMQLTPKDSVVNGLMPNPDRILEMFTVEAKCPDCGEMVEPDGLRANP